MFKLCSEKLKEVTRWEKNVQQMKLYGIRREHLRELKENQCGAWCKMKWEFGAKPEPTEVHTLY